MSPPLSPSNADRAAAYGMPGQRIDDNDVEAIYTAAGDAVARARAGEGPTLLEIHTLRLWGHFEGDPQAYRPELADVPGRDPIPAYEQRLTEAGVLNARYGGGHQGRGIRPGGEGDRVRQVQPGSRAGDGAPVRLRVREAEK